MSTALIGSSSPRSNMASNMKLKPASTTNVSAAVTGFLSQRGIRESYPPMREVHNPGANRQNGEKADPSLTPSFAPLSRRGSG